MLLFLWKDKNVEEEIINFCATFTDFSIRLVMLLSIFVIKCEDKINCLDLEQEHKKEKDN